MDPSRQAQQPDDALGASSARGPWRPDLPHHFLHPGPVIDPNTPVFSPGLPVPGQHEGLDNLASAAAISDPYGMPSGPNSTSPGGPPAFIVNDATIPSMTAAEQREQQKAKRRVPNSLRKRTQVSCDACKTRRCKCVRLRSSPGSDHDPARTNDQPPCKLCVETGIPCVTTMPRKQRVYGSVENLDKRYRALEALVTGLFPDLNPRASADDLVAFGREKSIAMPDFGEPSSQTQPSPAESTLQPLTAKPSEHGVGPPERNQSSNLVIAGTDHEKTVLPPSYIRMGFGPATNPQISPGTAVDYSMTDPNSGHTGLILDATGRSHYIGPCGSFTLFVKTREIFSQRFNHTGLRDSRRASRDLSSATSLLLHNPLAASLGGMGDSGRAVQSPSERGNSSSPHRNLDHLDGDSPPSICEDILRDHPDDPEFWRYRKRVSTLQLPPKDRADACVDAFFHSVHPNFILFHRLTFQGGYEKMWRCWEGHRNQGTNRRVVREVSVSTGWLCCLYMIFVLGSRSLPQSSESLDFQRKWFSHAETLPPLLGTSSLPNVCAYMLLALYYHNTNDRTSAWIFQGAACRLALALGMHRESASGLFDPVERQLRKLVWWTLYGFEQFLCCSLGRPSAIDDREMDGGIPNDDYLDANLLPPRYVENSARLNMLLSAVRRGIFDPGLVAGKMYMRALEFLDAVASWEDILPKKLKQVTETGPNGNENQWRSAMLLHVRYHHTVTFLTSPFLFETIQSAGGEAALGPDAFKVRVLSKVCLTAAMRSGSLIISLWREGLVNGVTWIDIFYAYMSSLHISLALLSPELLCQDEAHPEICNPKLIDRHTVEEMKETVARLCDVMSTIEVCGTNARFVKAAFEFAIALGIAPIDKTPIPGMQAPGPEVIAAGKDSNDKGGRVTEDAKDEQEQVQPTNPGKLDQTMTGTFGYFPGNTLSLDFQGSLIYPPSDAMSDVQWDM
ncbi:hypothetical protein F5Y04DRAFT_65910 [Hypomontagnella monticulosa]|nr:hypothetical protein F5Y04DRAFT_65910 [Hypomontagnella monticulosa]